MHKHLIIAAFDKAKDHAQLEGITNPSKSHMATLLSDYILQEVKFSITDRRLRDYYNEAIVIQTDKDIKIAQQDVINGLCQYLGYESYQAFLGNPSHAVVPKDVPTTHLPPKSKPLTFVKKHRTLLLSLLVVTVLVIYIVKINQLCWMVWNGETYEEAPYKAELVQNGTLKICNADRLEHFRQLKTITCDTEFFNADGSVKVWYGKNKNGDLEYFTSHGLHPETGKTLKPITMYMIRKYVCETY